MQDESICAGLKAMHLDLPLQECDEEPTAEDKEYARYFREGDEVETLDSQLLKHGTQRSVWWGRVVAVEEGWVTIQTGKSEKSLFKAHAQSLRPLIGVGMHFVEPSTGRVALGVDEREQLEYVPNTSPNPWVHFVLFGNRYRNGETCYQDLRLWQRKEKIDFIKDFDDFSGYLAFRKQFLDN